MISNMESMLNLNRFFTTVPKGNEISFKQIQLDFKMHSLCRPYSFLRWPVIHTHMSKNPLLVITCLCRITVLELREWRGHGRFGAAVSWLPLKEIERVCKTLGQSILKNKDHHCILWHNLDHRHHRFSKKNVNTAYFRTILSSVLIVRRSPK